MDSSERQLIDGLFDRLRQVDGQAPQRDGDAEQLIRQRISAMPVAPYYMAQAILVQEQALAASQQRIEELERQAAERPAGGGFLGSLFSAGSPRPAAPPASPRMAQPAMGARPGGPWGRGAGGGFMAGAMQTAMGVAGGMLVANAIGSMFADPAAAATPPVDTPPADTQPEEADAGFDDAGMDGEW